MVITKPAATAKKSPASSMASQGRWPGPIRLAIAMSRPSAFPMPRARHSTSSSLASSSDPQPCFSSSAWSATPMSDASAAYA